MRGFAQMPMGLQRSVNDLESIGYSANFIIPSAYASDYHTEENDVGSSQNMWQTPTTVQVPPTEERREKRKLQR